MSHQLSGSSVYFSFSPGDFFVVRPKRDTREICQNMSYHASLFLVRKLINFFDNAC